MIYKISIRKTIKKEGKVERKTLCKIANIYETAEDAFESNREMVKSLKKLEAHIKGNFYQRAYIHKFKRKTCDYIFVEEHSLSEEEIIQKVTDVYSMSTDMSFVDVFNILLQKELS